MCSPRRHSPRPRDLISSWSWCSSLSSLSLSSSWFWSWFWYSPSRVRRHPGPPVVVLALRVYVIVVPISSSPASFHPSSTPRAVAHGTGGGWCAGVGVGAGVVVGSSWWGPGAVPRRGGVLGPFLVMVGPWCSFLVVVGACCHPLTTQPASRGLQRWEWAGGVVRFVCLLVSRRSFVPLF